MGICKWKNGNRKWKIEIGIGLLVKLGNDRQSSAYDVTNKKYITAMILLCCLVYHSCSVIIHYHHRTMVA